MTTSTMTNKILSGKKLSEMRSEMKSHPYLADLYNRHGSMNAQAIGSCLDAWLATISSFDDDPVGDALVHSCFWMTTPLCTNGNRLEAYLSRGINPNTIQFPEGQTALGKTVMATREKEYGHLHVPAVHTLLRYGANPNIVIKSSWYSETFTPLDCAVAQNQLELVHDLLVIYHADPNVIIEPNTKRFDGQLYLGNALYQAAGNPAPNTRVVIANNDNNNNNNNNNNNHYNPYIPERSTTPDIVRLLFQHMNVEPIHHDSSSSIIDITTNETTDASTIASERGKMQYAPDDSIVHRQFKLPSKYTKIYGFEMEETVLHHATRSNSMAETIQVLLQYGANPNSRDAQGNTSLHNAIQSFGTTVETIQILLQYGADPNATDAQGDTPLHMVSSGIPWGLEILQVLVQYGANVHLTNLRGETPLHIQFTKRLKGQLEKLEFPRYLLQQGVNVNALDQQNQSALHYASQLLSGPYLVPLLLEYGADPNAGNCRALIHAASSKRLISTLIQLLDHGANPHQSYSMYNTSETGVNMEYWPLEVASKYNNTQAIYELLKRMVLLGGITTASHSPTNS